MIVHFIWIQDGIKKSNGSQMVVVTWPRWPPYSKLLKTLKGLLLQNYWANCLETWYVAAGTVVLQNLYKTCSWVDLDLIYGKVNFGSIGIWIGNAENFNFYFAIAL